MKVYIVTRGEYSDYHIVAIFSTEEDAKKYCALHNDPSDYPGYEIEEWDVDDVKFEGDIAIGYVYNYYAQFIFHGIDKTVNPEYVYVYKESCGDWDREEPMMIKMEKESVVIKEAGPYKAHGLHIYVYLFERDDKKALKIARDKLAELNANSHGV